MRNLKKLLAVVVAICVLATMTIPAFAAETLTDAEKCELIGVMKGSGGGVTDDYLSATTERYQAAVMYLRLLGLEQDAYDGEYDANYADATDLKSADMQKILGYIFANKDTLPGWEGVGGGKFEPTNPTTPQMIYKVMLEALGYEMGVDFEWADTLTFAEDKGLVKVADLDKLTNEDFATAIVEALGTKVKGGTKTLAQTLVDDGVIELADAVDAGLVADAAVIESVTAKAVDTLEVVFTQAVDTDDITLAVTRGTTAVPSTVAWNADKTVATITTTAKMITGVHTVTATSKTDAAYTSTGTVEIKSQYIAEIKIKDDTALTGAIWDAGTSSWKESMRAFVYYDVFDQYGQSVKATTNITWSFSAKQEQIDRTTGKITLSRSDGNAFTYNEQIYISGVDTKTGASVTKTVTVGQKQALDSIELAGYLKKGTTEILKALPSGFKADTYYMLYTIKDQNGNPFAAETPIANSQVTIIADNMLLINKFGPEERVLSINGVEYNAVVVQPGINVDKGGEVNITAIANNTGNKVVINTVVGANQILTTLNMSAPTGILADGESAVIPFDAFDQNGDKITNFTTLARNAQFNSLTFNASTGTLTLSEKDDGTAELKFSDNAAPAWTDSSTTDGVDRVVSLTSIIVGGNNSTLMLSIQDKARPEGIKSVNVPAVVVERGTIDFEVSGGDGNKFIFVDQYGREMGKADAAAFFASSFTAHGNQEFNGYTFAVRATYKGDDDVFSFASIDVPNNAQFEIAEGAASKVTLTANAGSAITSAKSGMAFQFDIVKYKTAEGFAKAVAVSTNKTNPVTVVDINAVKAYAVKDIAKVYVNTTKSSDATGDVGTPALTTVEINDPVGSIEVLASHKRGVSVTGYYNGVSVDVPAAYLVVEAAKVPVTGTDILGTSTSAATLKWSDLYDATSARYVRKDTSDTVKATIVDLDNGSQVIDSATKVFAISDAAPVATTIDGKAEFTVTPDLAFIDVAKIEDNSKGYKVKDQYGVEVAGAVKTYRATEIAENADGYAANSFKVSSNDSGTMSIAGAERGDKFALIIKSGNAELKVTVTVGADAKSNITGATNNYLTQLINNVLEPLRTAGLN